LPVGLYLLFLLFGFTCHLASAFTFRYSSWFGERVGALISFLLRNTLGIPIWALGYYLAARVPSARLFPAMLVSTTLAWMLIIVGGVLILVALTAIRVRAARPTIHDSLVSWGIYGHIRHPIYLGTSFELIGLWLLFPITPVLTACFLGIIWILLQTWLEELDLLQRHPGYREYMQAVPRFIPRLR